ncbi:tetratricopeptide repeat protein [Leptospira borgpetersenii]|uniref:tetratricopeptide repeat protein n=1 Tax=Leptospira borgpetersenii TaxID=174 RepID=UPI0007735F20|nr:tetratricopeptide repeat protein [Leptospira borgpetersenii]MBF3376258.1 tetratricopeptide repeat protein [Leptospira borgpetersenii serovar Balcanica]
MNRSIILITGFLFICAGLLIGVYQTTVQDEDSKRTSVLERIKEGEEYLKQTNPSAAEKAVDIFSELSAKEIPEEYSFRVKYDMGRALERNQDSLLALGIYRELNQKEGLSRDERSKVAYSMGNLLLQLNRDEEGKGHLEEVLRISADSKFRSNALSAIADYYMKKGNYDLSRKNYVLALQEDPENVKARVRWGKSLRRMGKDWSAYDVYDDYAQAGFYFDPEKEKVTSEFRSGILEKARQLYVRKQYYGAIDTFKKALEMGISPKAEEQALFYIAESYEAVGKSDSALQYLNRVLGNQDGSLDQTALFRKGTIYFKSGKYEKAAALFQEASDRYPDSPVGRKASAWKKESLDQIEDNLHYKESDKAKSKEDLETERLD